MSAIDISTPKTILNTGVLQLQNGVAMDSTLRNVSDQSNTTSPLKLSTSAVQVASTLQITTNNSTYLDIEDGSGNNRFTISRDPSSQQVNVDFASNPTGGSAIVGAIRTYVDDVNLSEIMQFREDGRIQIGSTSASAMYWDNTNNRVGIGTATPGVKLDVHSGADNIAQFNRTGSGNNYLQQQLAGSAKWRTGFTNSTGAYDIIDDVNSLTRLSVQNTGQLKLNAYTSTSAFTGTTAGFLAFDSTGNILSVATPATNPSGVAGSVQFSNGTSFASNAANFFWDNTNVRLGIGTNAPTGRLQVKGSGSTSATTSLLVQNSGGSQRLKLSDDGLLEINYINNNPVGVFLNGPSVGSYGILIGCVTNGGDTAIFTKGNNSGSSALRVTDQNIGASRNHLLVDYVGATGFNLANGTTTVNSSAQVEIVSTTKGFLPPRMTNAQRLAIATPAVGLMVYCTDAVEGLYVYKSTGWTFVI